MTTEGRGCSGSTWSGRGTVSEPIVALAWVSPTVTLESCALDRPGCMCISLAVPTAAECD